MALVGAAEHGVGEVALGLVEAQDLLLDGMLGDEVVDGDVLSLAYAVGTVSWHISSLDPMTVEPTEEPTSGVLPVNIDGNGIGELSFDIQLKPDLPDGTEIPNQATIVFDATQGAEDSICSLTSKYLQLLDLCAK